MRDGKSSQTVTKYCTECGQKVDFVSTTRKFDLSINYVKG